MYIFPRGSGIAAVLDNIPLHGRYCAQARKRVVNFVGSKFATFGALLIGCFYLIYRNLAPQKKGERRESDR